MTRLMTALLAPCLLLVACSSDSTTADSATATTVETPTTTEPATTEPATAEAPSTDGGALLTDADLVAAEQAYVDGFDAFLDARRDPSNSELRADIVRLYGGPNLQQATERLDLFLERDIIAVEQPDNPSFAVVIQPPVVSELEDDLVELVTCEVDAELLVEVGAAADGSDVLISDEVLTQEIRIRLRVTDGEWKSVSGELVATLTSPEECLQ